MFVMAPRSVFSRARPRRCTFASRTVTAIAPISPTNCSDRRPPDHVTAPLANTRRARVALGVGAGRAARLSSALGVGSMAIVAVRDPHFATEPDYYQKAIRWDQTQAQAATNQRLGYVIEVPAVAQLRSRKGEPRSSSRSAIGLGRPVHGAQLVGQAFANAYSGELVESGVRGAIRRPVSSPSSPFEHTGTMGLRDRGPTPSGRASLPMLGPI